LRIKSVIWHLLWPADLRSTKGRRQAASFGGDSTAGQGIKAERKARREPGEELFPDYFKGLLPKNAEIKRGHEFFFHFIPLGLDRLGDIYINIAFIWII
jgi:hypothetical protein